ncbi:DUF2723 domain-containing protein [Flavobacterium sp. RHBU_24]|uniref:glycosyltransferase family 117 protein n=1 Tax=Flavobacterium sp. RHBU_24 TaxID=3391185 RepID=UPI003984BD7E
MKHFDFKKTNTIAGWLIFSIALLVYSLTVEPTMSFWDCGEYLSASSKLQIPHPPGAPLFQMLGAAAASFAASPQQIALTINMVSVLASAFTILFMFWSLTLLLRETTKTEVTGRKNTFIVVGASAVGSLAFLFSDSFWFSAVEAEVYSLASLFIALILWAGLRWGAEMHQPGGNRWLFLIALLVGLSFGVHFMALLTLPSLGLIYYFKNYEKVTIKNFIIANILVVLLLFFVFAFLMPYTMAFFGKTEIFMVNTFGLPFNSGTIIAFIALAAVFYYGLRFTRKKQLPLYNNVILCILFILIGASSWIMLPIRANAHVVLNENNPQDAAELLAYYNREQYPEQKTLYGPLYTDTYSGLDKNEPYVDDKPNYERNYTTGKYEIVNQWQKTRQNGDNAHKGFLPRMHQEASAANYMAFAGPPEFTIDPQYDFSRDLAEGGIDISNYTPEEAAMAMGQARGQLEKVITEFKSAYAQGEIGNEEYDQFLRQYGRYLIVEKPGFGQNMAFMFDYQFGYMYARYLMWNFAGRQNDEQGLYDNANGNWMSGITAIDEARLGSQARLTQDMLNNKGRNIYYMLPFILGGIGLLYHARKNAKSFYVLLMLFLFTGIALKIFLNEKPFEVRERDYALVGSFYIFAMWIAFGAFAVLKAVEKYAPAITVRPALPTAFAALLLGVPVLMATQNWDDHDRSERYTAVAMAKAYLDSCDPNAILFTVGDNDTFPLWYAQEVEGYRTDVRIVCTTLLHADWYIDMMKQRAYTSAPLPISFTHKEYRAGTRDFLLYNPKTEDRIDIDTFIKFTHLEDERAKAELRNGQMAYTYPTNKISIPVNRDAIIKKKIVGTDKYDSIVKQLEVNLPQDAIYKGNMVMLDIIRNNNWNRPIYFAGRTNDAADFAWMRDYLQMQGMAYKLVPVKTPFTEESSMLDMGYVDTEKSYDTVKKWDWGNMGSPKIYHDPQTRHNGIAFRTTMARLMDALIKEKKTAKAKEVIDLAMQKMPVDEFGFYTLAEPFAGGYYQVGEKEKARKLLTKLTSKYKDSLGYYRSLPTPEQNSVARNIVTDIERYRSLLLVMQENNDTRMYAEAKKDFNECNGWFARFGREDEM